ncbi:hypothetical protein PSDVSF_09370 [Pseudodesulfovibrio sediminis]|uniref:Uncharacterized protein n=1 Tax=Pseudodesulfovibrio sediminis TaxID=2810563 RepID=A0ABN6ER39_9BACT|nr:hypothetical protein PSDVSF_09370 [Pseudodesulfovibrio sediminis]
MVILACFIENRRKSSAVWADRRRCGKKPDYNTKKKSGVLSSETETMPCLEVANA